MGMMKEFREFAIKGNVIDLAVGVIIGAAFSKIVDSVVSDLIMPVVGLVFGKLDFSNLFVVLGTVPAGTARDNRQHLFRTVRNAERIKQRNWRQQANNVPRKDHQHPDMEQHRTGDQLLATQQLA